MSRRVKTEMARVRVGADRARPRSNPDSPTIVALWPFCSDVAPQRVDGPGWMVGVYALISRGSIVYIGQSRDVQARINQHASTNRRLFSDGRPHHAMRFDRAIWMHLSASELDAFESALIRHLRPRHNGFAPRKDRSRDAEILAALGLVALPKEAQPVVPNQEARDHGADENEHGMAGGHRSAAGALIRESRDVLAARPTLHESTHPPIVTGDSESFSSAAATIRCTGGRA